MNKIALVFWMSLWSSVLFAHSGSFQLMYQGNPIDPLCFSDEGDKQGPISLKNCGLKAVSGRSRIGENQLLIEKGYTGYNYRIDLNGENNDRGFSYYRLIGKVGHSFVIETLNGGGGTGIFSMLQLVTRIGDKLNIETFSGGDRCNGGVNDVHLLGSGPQQRLMYQVNITPYDLFAIGEHGNIKPDESLPVCAICCIGTAQYVRQLKDDFKKEKLLYVKLSPASEIASVGDSQYQQHASFYRVFKQYLDKKQLFLNRKQLLLFISEVNTQSPAAIGTFLQ